MTVVLDELDPQVFAERFAPQGRKAAPSRYLEHVKAAAEKGPLPDGTPRAFQIKLTPAPKASQKAPTEEDPTPAVVFLPSAKSVVNELDKARKQLGLRVQIMDRSADAVVIYRVLPAKTSESEPSGGVTEDAPAS